MFKRFQVICNMTAKVPLIYETSSVVNLEWTIGRTRNSKTNVMDAVNYICIFD